MGYISKQWLKVDGPNRSHIPLPVVLSVTKGSYKDCKVTLTTTWLNGLGYKEYIEVDLTKEEVQQALPAFLRESDLTGLRKADPIRIAIIEALSKLSDATLNLLLKDIWAAKTKHEPPSTRRLNVADFAKELELPIPLLLEQLQEAGVGKEQEADAITEQDKVQLMKYLHQTHPVDTHAKGEHNIKSNPASNTTDVQEIQIMSATVVLAKLARAQIILEVRQGKRALDFVALRNIEKGIKVIEEELERSKPPL